jgi:NAD(P)H-dependent flavin oxidoreductase YrpB (nitropropane dioxygenase family)
MPTRICDILGMEYPIFAFSHQRDVVAAVSKAGGLGVLGAVALGPDALDVELAWLEEQLGDTPYGIDVIVPAHYVGDEQGGLEAKDLEAFIPQEQRDFVKGLLERYGVPDLPEGREASSGLLAWSAKGAASLLDIALCHKPRLIANALGAPPPDMVKRAHDAGLLVAALAGRPEHAMKHKQAGVDIVVAQGYEAGGHTGELSTMVLVPQVVDAVAPMPVLAAGGIACGRQMAAAMALGAEGIWTGSVWLTTEEAETHPVVKEKFLAATSYDTVRSRSLTGKPARQLKSAWNQSWDSSDSPDPLGMPLQTMLVSEAQLRISRAAATSAGARDLITYFVGQVVGQLNQVKPARRVLLDIVEEYADVLQRMTEQLS